MLAKIKKSVFSLIESLQLREVLETINIKYKTESTVLLIFIKELSFIFLLKISKK